MAKIKRKKSLIKKTPPEEFERLAERLKNEKGEYIKDLSTFEVAFNRMLDLDESELSPAQKQLRVAVFKKYLSNLSAFERKDVSSKRLFKRVDGVKPADIRREFTVPARIKTKVVRAEVTSVIVRGKEQLRLRDSKGRFASPNA